MIRVGKPSSSPPPRWAFAFLRKFWPKPIDADGYSIDEEPPKPPDLFITPTAAEIQSAHGRVLYAEGLILQLPENHDGRNSWLLNFGVGEKAEKFRDKRGLRFDDETQACETFHTCRRCQEAVSSFEFVSCYHDDCPERTTGI